VLRWKIFKEPGNINASEKTGGNPSAVVDVNLTALFGGSFLFWMAMMTIKIMKVTGYPP